MSVRLQDVSFQYGGSASPVVRNVSLQVERGGVTLLTGRTGAGCSTLLLVMAGLAPRVTGGELDGQVEILGTVARDDAATQALAGRVALLLPSPWMQLSGLAHTVWAEVAFGPANLGWSRDRIATSVERALQHLALVPLADRDPTTLSGGELQRVMIAGVLAMEPELLLLDEPALELDSAGARQLYDMLRRVARDTTVVMATTDVDRAAVAAHRVVVLQDGAIVAEGGPADVLGARERIADGTSTTVAGIGWRAGLAAPLPITVSDAAERFKS